MHPQIVTASLSALVGQKRKQEWPRLEYLHLNKQNPRPISSLAPEIDPEFLSTFAWKDKQRNDAKIVKRKIKKFEKDAVREIKKDTYVLQAEKRRVHDQVRKRDHKSVFRGGNKPRDEV